MAKPPSSSNDPADFLRNLISQVETNVDSLANQLMGTSQFSSTMNSANKLQLSLQRLFGAQMQRQLETFNMPSREDVIRLGETLHAIERRLTKIESRLDTLSDSAEGDTTRAQPPRTRVPRTKKPSPKTPPKKAAQPDTPLANGSAS